MDDDLERDDDTSDTPPAPAREPAVTERARREDAAVAAPLDQDDDREDDDRDDDDQDDEGYGDDDYDDHDDQVDQDDDDYDGGDDPDADRDDSPRETSSTDPQPTSESGGRSTFRESDLFRQQRKRLESTLRDVLRKAVERGVDAGVGAIEQSVDVIERSMEVGRGRVKSVREVIEDVKLPKDLPKDIANAIFSQIEEGKNVLVGAVASEVRGFLEDTDIAYELQRALTSLSFEISTEIRFVPNERGMPRAEVRSKARPKISSWRARRSGREDEPEQD
jgi:hypothetical protein